MFDVMSRDLKGSFYSPAGSREGLWWYHEKRDLILSPGSSLYGAVLVSRKRIMVGVSLKLKLRWRMWYWRPRWNWRYGKWFHWLFLMLWLDPEYEDVPDKVVMDHLEGTGTMDVAQDKKKAALPPGGAVAQDDGCHTESPR